MSFTSARNPLAAALVLVIAGASTTAHAYSTRVHIVMANRVREALIASGDDTIRLEWSPYSVTLSAEDAEAIRMEPLAFRAGAIGPDNMVFPALTDGTHALTQDPYRQCQMLYDDALLRSERAYALGCFLHGATDAIAHHFVNDFTGETFTLTPLRASRGSAFDNVIGHITTEGMIQDAFVETDPSWFTAGELDHDIPRSFVIRNYYSTSSPLWQRLAADAVERLDVARAAADPDDSFYTIVSSAELETYHYLALAPVFVSEAEMQRVALRQWVLDEIADMQDMTSSRGSQLRVGAGSDGMLSTEDDTTACDTGCPSLFAQYFVFVRLLLPRFSSGGTELPAAYDVVMDELGDDLTAFIPALLATIESLSAALNTPLSGPGSGFDLEPSAIAGHFTPMTDWVDDVTLIDFETVTRAVAPDWLTALDDFLDSIGITIDLSTILEMIFAPITDAIRMVVRDFVIAQAQTYLEDLRAAYDEQLAPWTDSEEDTLAAGSPTDITGTTLDHLRESGLYAYSFNFTSVVLADHRVVLVDGDPIANGPTSFDASYTPTWSQAGLCDYLRGAVFPEGFDMHALFSVRDADGTLHASPTTTDSPVECHAGSLAAFGAPSRTTCEVVGLEALLDEPTGSLSRAYPPLHAAGTPGCMRLTIAGLPDPPPVPDAGPTPDGGGLPGSDGGPISGVDAGPGGATTDGSCACAAAGARSGEPTPLALGFALALLVAVARRRRRSFATLAIVSTALALSGCPSDPMPGTDAGDGTDAGRPTDGGGGGGSDTGTPSDDGGTDAGRDGGMDLRRVLLDALGSSTWSALQTRPETSGAGATDVERAYEMEFDASMLLWAETRNPFGPARRRRLRIFSVDRDGETVTSTVMTPDSWPTDPIDGRAETWTFEIVAGTPRELHVTDDDGNEEVFLEEPWAAPAGGLTAEVRAFANDGAMAASGCDATFINDTDRQTILGFARGTSAEMPLAYDVVAGSAVNRIEGAAAFSVRDVDGFDDLGGSALTQQVNFVVRWTGTVTHGGGNFQMREGDDQLDGGLVAFIQGGVGSMVVGDIFLEVQNSFSADATSDTVSRSVAAGDLPIEVIVWRCTGGSENADVEINIGGGFGSIGPSNSSPIVNDTLFPPAL